MASSVDALTIPSPENAAGPTATTTLDVHWRDNTGLGLPLHCGVVRFEDYPYWISEVYSVTNVQPVVGAPDEYTANLAVPSSYIPSDMVCRVLGNAGMYPGALPPVLYSNWSNSLRYPRDSTLPTYVPEPGFLLTLTAGLATLALLRRRRP